MRDVKQKDDAPKKTYRQSPWGTGAMDWKDETKGDGLKQAFRAFSMLGGVGIYMLVFVGIFVFLGYEFDATFGTGHAGRLAGIILGFPSAMYSLYRQLKKGGIV